MQKRTFKILHIESTHYLFLFFNGTMGLKFYSKADLSFRSAEPSPPIPNPLTHFLKFVLKIDVILQKDILFAYTLCVFIESKLLDSVIF